MASQTLTNTFAQLDCTIKETYLKLTGGYVGSTGTNNASTASFGIRSPDQNTGMLVGNSFTTFYNNSLNFCEGASNLNLCLSDGTQCVILRGGSTNPPTYCHVFDEYGTLAINSGVLSPSTCKGLQIINDSPNIVLRDCTAPHALAISFLNSGNSITFRACQNSTTGTNISGFREIIFNTYNVSCSLALSGNYIGINSNFCKDYNLFTSGKSYFSDCASFNSGVVISGDKTKVFVICNNSSQSGMYIDSASVFMKSACFCAELKVCDNNICTNKCVCAGTGYFCNVIGQGCVDYVSGLFNNLCVDGGSNGAYFNVDTCFDKPVYFRNNIISTGLVNCFSGCNCMGVVKVTGNLCHIGKAFTVCPTGNEVHSMSGCCFTFNANNSVACNFVINANLLNTGSAAGKANQAIFNSICTVDETATNKFSGTLCIQKSICSPVFSGNVSGSIGCFTSCVYAVTALCSQGSTITNSICSIGADVLNCFSSPICVNGNISGNGFVSSINTPKAWGIYSLKCGVPTILTGYNICNYMTIPITGIRVTGTNNGYGSTGSGTIESKYVWSSPFVFYGVRLCNTVKWPFTFDMKFNPVGVFNQNVWGAGGIATGTGTFGVYSSTSGVYGFTGSQLCQPLISTLVNCAGCNVNGNYLCTDFKQLCFNCSYNEVVFNLSPTITNCANYYSILNTSALNGTGSFVIYSY